MTQRQALIPKLTKRTGIHRAAVAGIPSLGHCSTFIISTQQKPRMTHRQCNPQSVGRVWARLGFPRTLFGSVRAHGFSAESSLGSSHQPVQGAPTDQIQLQLQFAVFYRILAILMQIDNSLQQPPNFVRSRPFSIKQQVLLIIADLLH